MSGRRRARRRSPARARRAEGSAVGVVERHAGAHLRDVGRRVVVVALEERPAEPVGDEPADGGLPAARDAHDDDDHGWERSARGASAPRRDLTPAPLHLRGEGGERERGWAVAVRARPIPAGEAWTGSGRDHRSDGGGCKPARSPELSVERERTRSPLGRWRVRARPFPRRGVERERTRSPLGRRRVRARPFPRARRGEGADEITARGVAGASPPVPPGEAGREARLRPRLRRVLAGRGGHAQELQRAVVEHRGERHARRREAHQARRDAGRRQRRDLLAGGRGPTPSRASAIAAASSLPSGETATSAVSAGIVKAESCLPVAGSQVATVMAGWPFAPAPGRP